jgi:hypothetical protein
VRAQYDFFELTKQHIIVLADLFNALNLRETNSIFATDTPTTFGQVAARRQPFRFQLAARYYF